MRAQGSQWRPIMAELASGRAGGEECLAIVLHPAVKLSLALAAKQVVVRRRRAMALLFEDDSSGGALRFLDDESMCRCAAVCRVRTAAARRVGATCRACTRVQTTGFRLLSRATSQAWRRAASRDAVWVGMLQRDWSLSLATLDLRGRERPPAKEVYRLMRAAMSSILHGE